MSRLPEILEDRASSVLVTWFRATLIDDATIAHTDHSMDYTIPAGTGGWARPTSTYWTFAYEATSAEYDHGWLATHPSSLEIDYDDFIEQTYILPERYWAEYEEER